MDVKTTVIKLSQELHAELKIQAIREGRQLQQLVDQALRDYLSRQTSKTS